MGLTLIAAVWPSHKFKEVRADIEGTRQESARVDANRRGPAAARTARREVGRHGGRPQLLPQAVWSRAGRSSAMPVTSKDPITAQGISDAFIDAEHLADALDAGFAERRALDEALAAYQSSRDERVKPLYHFTCELAKLEPPAPQMQAALRRAARES